MLILGQVIQYLIIARALIYKQRRLKQAPRVTRSLYYTQNVIPTLHTLFNFKFIKK